jgi:hypothetical protein
VLIRTLEVVVAMCAAPVLDPPTGPDAAPVQRRSAHYLHGPLADAALAFAWVPFALVVWWLAESGATAALALAIATVFVISFSHQPLTVALVYGDKTNFRLRRAIFTWSPLVFVAAVVVGYRISFTLLAIVGGLWNAEHTLMQRYGITRIYGRKAGQDDGLVEKLMLWSWLLLALFWAGANPATPRQLARVDFGKANEEAINVLVDLAPIARVLMWGALAASLVLMVTWVVQERRRAEVNPLKWLYLGATGLLFVVMLINPLAGIMGYVGAHAIEYFVIVHQSLGRRYTSATDDGGAFLGRVVRARTGRWGFMIAYGLAVFALVTVLSKVGSDLLYFVVFFTLGGMHVFYDGFIWKRPAADGRGMLAVPRAPSRS